jgi:hypothetical protein
LIDRNARFSCLGLKQSKSSFWGVREFDWEEMSEPDLLFTVRNNFYLGAFQSAIAEASDLEGLSDAERIERDCFVYRSYIELGSFEVGQIYISYVKYRVAISYGDPNVWDVSHRVFCLRVLPANRMGSKNQPIDVRIQCP